LGGLKTYSQKTEKMSSGSSGGGGSAGGAAREHLQMRMEANLRITSHELICFRELVKAANNDEVKLSQIAHELSSKAPTSVAFFEKVINENTNYFKNVHPQIFQFGGADVSVNQIIGKFLLFWYVIRPFTPIAAFEERFTFHSIQHAFFEFTAYFDAIRTPLQIQTWSAYVLSVHQQNYQISIQQNKALYDSYAELKSNECIEAAKLLQESEIKINSLLEKCKTLESDKEALIECKKLVSIQDLKAQQDDEQIRKQEMEKLKLQNQQDLERCEKSRKADAARAEELIKLQNSSIKFNRQELAALNAKYKGKEEELTKCNARHAATSALLKSTAEELKSTAEELKSKAEELAATNLKNEQLEAAFKSSEQESASLKLISARNDEKKKPPPPIKENRDKILRSELAKAQKIISGLEEELITALSNPNSKSSSHTCKKGTKEILDENVQDARVLVDLFATALKGEKILQVLQNYVVSSMRDNKIDEFPAWLVVGQSILRSICVEVGFAKGYLSGRYCDKDADKREDVFMGLLCWKVESRFRALSWLRNQVIRGYSENGKMGNVLLQSFVNYVVENQKIGGKITLASGKTSAELAMEMSALNVLKRESLMLLDKESFVPLSGAVFIPMAPTSLSDGVLISVRNFAYLNVCCFICLMEAESDSIKKVLLDIFFDLLDAALIDKKTTKNNYKTNLTPDRIMGAHDKIVAAFPSDERFVPLLNQFKTCADSFQDLYAKTFLFFDSHSKNEIDFFRQRRILTLHNHAESLLDSFWATQELSHHSEKLRDEIPESLIGKIMAMEVLSDEEHENVLSARKNLEVLLMSLMPPGNGVDANVDMNEYKAKSTIDETNFFLHAISHLLINGELLVDLQSKPDKCTSEEIIGFLCNQAQGSELREFITAIQESIHSFKEVRKGKKVMVQGKSSLGKILQSLSQPS